MPSNQQSNTFHSTHILLVEDAIDLALVIVRELETAGYNVTHVANGELALQVEQKGQFQLVILDWMLTV